MWHLKSLSFECHFHHALSLEGIPHACMMFLQSLCQWSHSFHCAACGTFPSAGNEWVNGIGRCPPARLFTWEWQTCIWSAFSHRKFSGCSCRGLLTVVMNGETIPRSVLCVSWCLSQHSAATGRKKSQWTQSTAPMTNASKQEQEVEPLSLSLSKLPVAWSNGCDCVWKHWFFLLILEPTCTLHAFCTSL